MRVCVCARAARVSMCVCRVQLGSGGGLSGGVVVVCAQWPYDLLRHHACIAVRGAVLSALRVARAEAHAAFDTTAAQRRADDDDIDVRE